MTDGSKARLKSRLNDIWNERKNNKNCKRNAVLKESGIGVIERKRERDKRTREDRKEI